jgi:phosphoserine aminotransferase
MNVPFFLADDRLVTGFLADAAEAGLIGLKGHRVIGGVRASLYNAMPVAGVEALVEFMRAFQSRHG